MGLARRGSEEPLPPTPSPKRGGGDQGSLSASKSNRDADGERLSPGRPLPASGRGSGGEVASWRTPSVYSILAAGPGQSEADARHGLDGAAGRIPGEPDVGLPRPRGGGP